MERALSQQNVHSQKAQSLTPTTVSSPSCGRWPHSQAIRWAYFWDNAGDGVEESPVLFLSHPILDLLEIVPVPAME